MSADGTIIHLVILAHDGFEYIIAAYDNEAQARAIAATTEGASVIALEIGAFPDELWTTMVEINHHGAVTSTKGPYISDVPLHNPEIQWLDPPGTNTMTCEAPGRDLAPAEAQALDIRRHITANQLQRDPQDTFEESMSKNQAIVECLLQWEQPPPPEP